MNEFITDSLREKMEKDLPPSMLAAQRAIDSEEVRAIMEKLAKYNLGVCMPHMHKAGGDFLEQPSGVIGVEDKTDFMPAGKSAKQGVLPVAWRWKDGAVEVTGSCHILKRKCDG